MPLERKTRCREERSARYVPCEFPGCVGKSRGVDVGARESTSVLYIAGYKLGAYCDDHEKVMRAAWLTDEALASSRATDAKSNVAYPVQVAA